jgi:hypothetical protein
MQETDWINEAVKEFKKGCQELQREFSNAANGTLLDVSDEQIMKNLEPLLKKVQQQAIQKAIEKAQKDLDYRRCNKYKKNETQKSKIFRVHNQKGQYQTERHVLLLHMLQQ